METVPTTPKATSNEAMSPAHDASSSPEMPLAAETTNPIDTEETEPSAPIEEEIEAAAAEKPESTPKAAAEADPAPILGTPPREPEPKKDNDGDVDLLGSLEASLDRESEEVDDKMDEDELRGSEGEVKAVEKSGEKEDGGEVEGEV